MSKRHRPGVSAASVLRHVEEVVVATSGEDTFELVFALAAARLDATKKSVGVPALRAAIAEVAARRPALEVAPVLAVPDELVAKIDTLLRGAFAGKQSVGVLDAVFESLVPRVAKSDKGQFFTPRHVVDFVVEALAPKRGELVVDPACGSGAFLSHARAHAKGVRAEGFDVDLRAVRVARLLALAAGAAPETIVRGDGLRKQAPPADVVATNPPFAGRAAASGFEVAKLVRTPERDVLFLERALDLLKPDGRLGIVLPYNKANGTAYVAVRRWLFQRARVFAVVGLPRETFLPHTSQRTFVLFAKRRGRALATEERTMFLASERAGKDAGGEPIYKDDVLDHDLAEVGATLGTFLRKEGFFRKSTA